MPPHGSCGARLGGRPPAAPRGLRTCALGPSGLGRSCALGSHPGATSLAAGLGCQGPSSRRRMTPSRQARLRRASLPRRGPLLHFSCGCGCGR
eukprot:3666662-Pyramimonas_sp.AAC.1